MREKIKAYFQSKEWYQRAEKKFDEINSQVNFSLQQIVKQVE